MANINGKHSHRMRLVRKCITSYRWINMCWFTFPLNLIVGYCFMLDISLHSNYYVWTSFQRAICTLHVHVCDFFSSRIKSVCLYIFFSAGVSFLYLHIVFVNTLTFARYARFVVFLVFIANFTHRAFVALPNITTWFMLLHSLLTSSFLLSLISAISTCASF